MAIKQLTNNISLSPEGKSIAKIREVRGNTLVWNQKVPVYTATTTTYKGLTLTPTSTGVYTISGTTDGSGNIIFQADGGKFVSGHKYFFGYYSVTAKIDGVATNQARLYLRDTDNNVTVGQLNPNSTETAVIATAGSAGTIYVYLNFSAGVAISGALSPMAIDLTQEYGSGHEPTVAEFEALYPLPYYAYNAGTLINNKATALETVGFNLVNIADMPTQTGTGTVDSDGVWYVPIPSVKKTVWTNSIGYNGRICCRFDIRYSQASSNGLRFKFSYTDGSSETIYPGAGSDYHTSTSISTEGKVVDKILTDYGSSAIGAWVKNLCINLSDPSKNGTYEPYKKNTLSLNIPTLTGKLNGEGSSVTICADGLKSAGSAYDYGVVENGFLTKIVKAFYKLSGSDMTLYNTSSAGYKTYLKTEGGLKQWSAVHDDYINNWGIPGVSSFNSATVSEECFQGVANNNSIYVVLNPNRSVADFEMYYPLATPLTYILDTPIPMYYDVDGGTERVISADELSAPIVFDIDYFGEAIKHITFNDEKHCVRDERITGVDELPTERSTNIITSGGVYDAISSATSTVEITHSALVTLRTNNGLVPGKVYRITDYVATTVDTESRSVNHQFDILVLAKDSSHLYEEAGAALHSGDTYFANTNFSAWHVWYCLDNDTTRFTWADSTNGKGVIYRLIDEWNNDVPYDFKSIQFKRYKVTAQTAYTEALSSLNGLYIGLSGTQSKGFDIDSSDFKWYYTFSKLGSDWTTDPVDDSILGTYTNNNEFGATIYTNGRSLNNLVFAYGPIVDTFRLSINANIGSSYLGGNVVAKNNHFGENISQVTVLGYIANNVGQSQFRKNIIVGSFRHSTLGSDIQNNTLVVIEDNSFNNIDSYFTDNIVVSIKDIAYNTVQSDCSGNYINCAEIYGNIIGHYCIENTVSCSKITDVVTEGHCQNNTITGNYEFSCISIKSNFLYNTITLTGNSRYCEIGESFRTNSLYGYMTYCKFGDAVSNNTFGNSTTSATLQTILIANAFQNNTITGQFYNIFSYGQITYCEFNGPIKNSSFNAILQYLVIAAGTSSSQFAFCDINGAIRGASASAKIILDAPEFRVSSVSGVKRRVTIEGDNDGKIVATWFNGQKRVGIYKTTSDSTWTALPETEYAANKVTSISSSSTDTQYPSAKCVYDSIPVISTDVVTDKASNTKVSSPASVYEEIHPLVVTTQPGTGMLPNVLYDLGTLTGTVTFSIASAPDSNIVNHWYWTFETSSTAPTITWPAAITSWYNGAAPTISASHRYEVSLLDGVAVCMEI